jgi:hypothetical protein
MNNNIKEVLYNTPYLSTDIVENCFIPNQHTFVDKNACGNGFTTAFLNILPTESYKCNLIIVPNRQVIISKQESYHKDNNTNKIKIGFLYGDDSADGLEFHKFDVMMFVADSFINYIDRIKNNENYIDKLLIDESHTYLIQSSYRKALNQFQKLVVDTFPTKAIVSVTATPMLSQVPNVVIRNKNILKRDINVSQNQERTIDRIQADLRNNKKVIIALQDARILKKLTDKDNKLAANVKVGVTMFQKILENVVLDVDVNSNLTIISSSGFEGFDVSNGVNNIYIFEDRAFDYQTFYSQNIVQIIGRSRGGTKYIEWSRIPHLNRTELLPKETMIKKANSDRISYEKKLTDKNYSYIPKFFEVDFNDDFGLITGLTFNDDKYNLAKELEDGDLKGLSIYDEFFKDRGFTLKYIDDGTKRLNIKAPSHLQAFKNVKLNKDVLKKFDLFKDVRLDLYTKGSVKEYIKAYEVYLRRKYWSADELVFTMEASEYLHVSKDLCNEMKCYNILIAPIDDFIKYLIKDGVQKKQQELYRKNKEYKQWESNFKQNIQDRFIRLVMAVSQPKIYIPKKIRNNRDYNLTTEISMRVIKEAVDLFNNLCTEVDITSCNPRIIYALCGLDLPTDFYGKNKENKRGINKVLNQISKYHPISFKYDVDKYKYNKVQELRKYGFDERVISFLFKEFWNRPKDSLFNTCAYHEKKIIDKLTNELINTNESSGNSVQYIRRHDSVIVFGAYDNIEAVTDNFDYLGFNGWFNGKHVPLTKADDDDDFLIGNYTDEQILVEGMKEIKRLEADIKDLKECSEATMGDLLQLAESKQKLKDLKELVSNHVKGIENSDDKIIKLLSQYYVKKTG